MQHPRPRRHNTAPPRLRKRDIPTAWDLFALDERASAASVDEDDSSQASAPSSLPLDLSRESSFGSSIDHQHLHGFDSCEQGVRGGSWPRYRKQRTSSKGSMSLFEVAEALGSDHDKDSTDMSAHLATLVAAEQDETSSSTDAMSSLSIETFVRAVFDGIAPAMPHADSGVIATDAPSTAAPADDADPFLSSPPLGGPAVPRSTSAGNGTAAAPNDTRPGAQRCRTANDLALLEAIQADEAAAKAASAMDQRRAMRVSPTFAACMGNLDDPPAPAADDDDDVVRPPTHARAHPLTRLAASSTCLAARAAPLRTLASKTNGGPRTCELRVARSTTFVLLGPPPSPLSFAGRHLTQFRLLNEVDVPSPHGLSPHIPSVLLGISHPFDSANALYEPLPPQHPPCYAGIGWDGIYSATQAAPCFQLGSPRNDYLSMCGQHSATGGHGQGMDGFNASRDGGSTLSPSSGEALSPTAADLLAGHFDTALGSAFDSSSQPASAHSGNCRHGISACSGSHEMPSHPLPAPIPMRLHRRQVAAVAHAALSAALPAASDEASSHHETEAPGRASAADYLAEPVAPEAAMLLPANALELAPRSAGFAIGMPDPVVAVRDYAAAPATSASVGPPIAGGGSNRNGAERKEWSVQEDGVIRQAVLENGCRWRKIAALLPGRSDDAVRNRWNRLKEMGIGSTPPPGAPSTNSAAATGAATIGSHESEAVSTGGLRPTSSVVTCAHGGSSAACSTLAAEKQAAGEREKPERISWSRAEDETILRGVSELGHKWNKITERLPGRTDHAIRNRFHRLQTLLEDRQRQQQRSFAPAMPLPTGQPVDARAFKGAGSELSAAIGGSDSEECTGSGGGFATPGS